LTIPSLKCCALRWQRQRHLRCSYCCSFTRPWQGHAVTIKRSEAEARKVSKEGLTGNRGGQKRARRRSNQRPASCSREHCGKRRQKKRRNCRRETEAMARNRKRRSHEKRRQCGVREMPTNPNSNNTRVQKTSMAPKRIKKSWKLLISASKYDQIFLSEVRKFNFFPSITLQIFRILIF